MTSPIQIALSQGRTVRLELVWKRRIALTTVALAGALAIAAVRLAEYADYLASAARV